MHLRRASEIFIDETYRVPDILIGPDRAGECALTVASGGRTVASLTTRHLVAALEVRCRSALRTCLGDAGPGLRTRALRLDRVGSSGARVFRLTAWVEQLDDDEVVFSVRAADDGGSRCEATITLTGTPSPRP
jgi:hypothetical protein